MLNYFEHREFKWAEAARENLFGFIRYFWKAWRNQLAEMDMLEAISTIWIDNVAGFMTLSVIVVGAQCLDFSGTAESSHCHDWVAGEGCIWEGGAGRISGRES